MKHLIVLFALLLSVSAFASSKSELIAPLYQDLEFKLTVEWDQKDGAFYNEALKNFKEEILKLKDQGVTSEDIFNYLKESSKDAKVSDEINEIINSVDLSKMDLQETNDLLNKYATKAFSKGASYHGRNNGWGVFWYLAIFGGVYYAFSYSYTPTPTTTYYYTPYCVWEYQWLYDYYYGYSWQYVYVCY